VLTQFESAGLVERHNFEGGHSVFELARGGHHDHMVCVDSGRVDRVPRRRRSKSRQRAIVAESRLRSWWVTAWCCT
jgi:Fur family ferric uptake transcriptional regulator